MANLAPDLCICGQELMLVAKCIPCGALSRHQCHGELIEKCEGYDALKEAVEQLGGRMVEVRPAAAGKGAPSPCGLCKGRENEGCGKSERRTE